MSTLKVDDIVHGYAHGYFGRDSYNCRRVVIAEFTPVGPYVVLWNGQYFELLQGARTIHTVAENKDDRSHCDEDCEGPHSV